MRDDIINILKNSKKALTIYELQDKLDLHDVSKVKELSEELRKMEEEVIIYCSNKGRSMLLQIKKVLVLLRLRIWMMIFIYLLRI